MRTQRIEELKNDNGLFRPVMNKKFAHKSARMNLIFPMHGTKFFTKMTRNNSKNLNSFDYSKDENINRRVFRPKYFEKHFMEEMLKA